MLHVLNHNSSVALLAKQSREDRGPSLTFLSCFLSNVSSWALVWTPVTRSLIRTLLSCDQGSVSPLLGKSGTSSFPQRTWNAVASVFPRWHNLKFFWYSWKYLRQAERGVSVDSFVLSIRFGKLIQNGREERQRAPIARSLHLWEDPVPSKELLYVNLSKFHQSIGCASKRKTFGVRGSCKLLSCLPSQPPEWPAKCQSGWICCFETGF